MNGRMGWGMAALLALITTGMGCAQTGPMVRGQNPDMPVIAAPGGPETFGPIIGSAPGYGDIKNKPKTDFKTFSQFKNDRFGYEGGYYSGPEGYSTDYDKRAYKWGGDGHGHDGCPHCQNGGACPPSGCKHCGRGCPKNIATYQYNWPQNQVYPPAAQPPAMVQYPYYTFRGPTDFFMK